MPEMGPGGPPGPEAKNFDNSIQASGNRAGITAGPVGPPGPASDGDGADQNVTTRRRPL
jgi:hypothetical protein